MLSKILSAANIGLDAVLVTCEVDVSSQGLPSFTIVGLGDRAVEESKERVRAAFRNTAVDFPLHKITVNLAPADMPKEGPSYDLPIALGILKSGGQISSEAFDRLDLSNALVVGELSLDGTLRKINGVLPLAVLAKQKKIKRMVVPKENGAEAAIVGDLEVWAADSLQQIMKVLLGAQSLTFVKKPKLNLEENLDYEYDFSQIKGQENVKRALEISAAGGHNVLMKGPPGAGKTMLARSFPSILPPLSFEEAIEVTKIYSIAGLLNAEQSLITVRPFRAPHHSASHVGLIGGGNNIRPGEISLSHRGVLFLDEIAEFPRLTLESLRQPLEDHHITISRASGSIRLPSQFILIAAQNPCPCGFLGDRKKQCFCMPGQIAKYKRRISGPFLDRIDIYLEVPAVEVDKLSADFIVESSFKIRRKVMAARKIQQKRFKGRIITNSEMNNNDIRMYCPVTQEGLDLLKMAISSLNLSARGYHRVLKLSRTIADLAQIENIQAEHIAEALQYRVREES
ncbi:YifB family Mg chelatase-like AAA ATPase [Candidatus Daviesbacteria bacterium]|nr:YifB family Mg chelatase-like AAA ATPase [Candidatus Daviesbacteria bacterium]